jgi:hypothetical protein
VLKRGMSGKGSQTAELEIVRFSVKTSVGSPAGARPHLAPIPPGNSPTGYGQKFRGLTYHLSSAQFDYGNGVSRITACWLMTPAASQTRWERVSRLCSGTIGLPLQVEGRLC